MDAFFLDPNVERLPPEETRILDLCAEPYPEGKRVRISLELTPFQQRPYIELTLNDPDGNEVSSASIVEPMGCKLELTMHLRPSTSLPPVAPLRTGAYQLTAVLSYPDLGEIDRLETSIVIPTITQ
ncbi:MAG: hypothetical protein COY47_00035 [Chloroflexi bacterium CG_4_10_14_0_8_um_filter_57_5]|nr:MAG: hypothetical protein COY47_00035 [Chloroflexi bacterium CG_4_10_14_0_8_um_filter_57_5]PJH76035.1 MAG: hypothetical protein CO064_03435 [Anaerolineae bacterium CG_4_9_14_0_8_um_filter_58_9]